MKGIFKKISKASILGIIMAVVFIASYVFASIPLGSNFQLNSQLPLDARTVVADLTARDAIPSGQRYQGLTVYVVSNTTNYQLQGGILNANWTAIGTGGGSSLLGSTSTLGTETWFGTDPASMAASTNGTVFIGISAGQNATNALSSTFIGDYAGINATDSTSSDFIGLSSGQFANNAYSSNFFGVGAGFSSYNAFHSSFFGDSAGSNSPNAAHSIFIGDSAGGNDTVDNTVSGTSILIGDNTNTGGKKNSIAIGAGARNTMSNQFLIAPAYINWQIAGVDYVMPTSPGGVGTVLTNDGSGNLSWNPSLLGSTSTVTPGTSTETWLGNSVTGMGTASTNGTVFIGISAGQNATSADDSNFIGDYAGQSATSADSSNFLGLSAGNGATDAYESNFLGTAAGNLAINAFDSNFLGIDAGNGATNAAHSIFIGKSAGFNDTVNNTVSGTSILIGDNTSTGSYSNSIAIGASATNTASNQFLIGSTYTQLNMRGVNYTMPSSQGGVGTVLTNDGSGGLTWGNGGSQTPWISDINANSYSLNSLNNITLSGNILPTVIPVNNNITSLDTTGDVGQYSSIAFASDGFARIAYYDVTNGNLKYVQCTNDDCTIKNITTVDSAGDVGKYASIVIATDGFARISYYDVTNGDLKYAQCTNDACTSKNITTVDSTGDVGQYVSSILASDDFVRISYYDVTNGDLKFAQCTNAACTTNSVNSIDTSGDVGRYTSVIMASDGYARISYYDVTNGDLKFAQCMSDDCTMNGMNIIDSTGDVGQYTSMNLGFDGFARISYYDVTNRDLKFAQCTDNGCTNFLNVITTIDSTGDVGQYTSMNLGFDGFAHISYYDATNGDLKLAQCTSNGCTTSNNINPIDIAGNVGQYSSISFSTDGLARISYYDFTNGDLKFFRALNATGSSFTGGSNIGSPSNPFNSVYATNVFSTQSFLGNFDLAENYPTKDTNLDAGYIVSLDDTNPVFVKKADNKNRVIGIVSTMPGSILGGYNNELYKDEKKVPIALSGRVPVKVNLENGPISQGDDISLSSTDGIGKKAKPNEDTVGIALESYDGTSQNNSILVFVHLQTSLSDLNLKVQNLSSLDTTSATSLGSLITKFLSDVGNGIGTVFFGQVNTKKLCLDDVCVTKDQLQQLLNQIPVAQQDQNALPTAPSTDTTSTTTPPATTSSTTTTNTTPTDTSTTPSTDTTTTTTGTTDTTDNSTQTTNVGSTINNSTDTSTNTNTSDTTTSTSDTTTDNTN